MAGRDLPADFVQQRDRLLNPSHEEHEEIIRMLQDYPDDASVEYLRLAIELKPKLAYLSYDDYGAYYKKCLWALQEIDTEAARALIQACAESDIPALKQQALYRLKRIAEVGPWRRRK
jgi:hypothetical protein